MPQKLMRVKTNATQVRQRASFFTKAHESLDERHASQKTGFVCRKSSRQSRRTSRKLENGLVVSGDKLSILDFCFLFKDQRICERYASTRVITRMSLISWKLASTLCRWLIQNVFDTTSISLSTSSSDLYSRPLRIFFNVGYNPLMSFILIHVYGSFQEFFVCRKHLLLTTNMVHSWALYLARCFNISKATYVSYFSVQSCRFADLHTPFILSLTDVVVFKTNVGRYHRFGRLYFWLLFIF